MLGVGDPKVEGGKGCLGRGDSLGQKVDAHEALWLGAEFQQTCELGAGSATDLEHPARSERQPSPRGQHLPDRSLPFIESGPVAAVRERPPLGRQALLLIAAIRACDALELVCQRPASICA